MDDDPANAANDALQAAATRHAETWRRAASNEVAQHRRQRRAFETAMEDDLPWSIALERLDHFWLRCRHVVRRYQRRQGRFGRAEWPDPDWTFEACWLLFGRALLVGDEVIALLRSGHASGALARWRTLFEVAVIATFLQERYDNELSLRCLEHRFVIHADDADKGFMQPENPLVGELTRPHVIANSRKRRDELLRRHGSEYRATYGWAAAVIARPDWIKANAVQFGDLVKAVGGEEVRRYEKLAHIPTHGGAAASYWDPGRPPEWNRAPAGATNMGLALAGHATAPTLALATSAFLNVHRDIESAVDIAALTILAGECRDLFERTDYALATYGRAPE